MLKKYYISFTAAILILTGSCDVLNQSPEQAIPTGQVFTSESNVRAVLAGVYSALQGQLPDQYIAAELAAETTKHSGSLPRWAMIDHHNVVPKNLEITDSWSDLYNIILRANNIIKYTAGVEDAGFTEEEKNAIVAKARIIRALCYHSLVRWYGGVPLVLEPVTKVDESIYKSRSSIQEVYDQIIKDLTGAAATLGKEGTPGSYTPTGLTAYALLSRVYLDTGEYGLAEKAATTVINSGVYTLANDYAAIYAGSSSGEIFTLNFTSEDGNGLAFFAYPQSAGGRYEYAPTATYVASFESGDERLAVNVGEVSGLSTITKYYRVVDGSDDVCVIRLGEVFLNRAEARARQGGAKIAGAMSDVNKIRNRAGLADTSAASKAQALGIILEERAHELFLEGHRWFDLQRFGVAQQVLNINSENYLVWPVPEAAMNSNPKMEQNPGY